MSNSVEIVKADQRLSRAIGEISDAVSQVRLAWKNKAFEAEGRAAAAEADLANAGEEFELLQGAYQKLANQLGEYQGQGGIVNMDRSWKTKYRNALAEANQRLIDAGLDPVRIRTRDEGIAEKPFESQQMKLVLDGARLAKDVEPIVSQGRNEGGTI